MATIYGTIEIERRVNGDTEREGLDGVQVVLLYAALRNTHGGEPHEQHRSLKMASDSSENGGEYEFAFDDLKPGTEGVLLFPAVVTDQDKRVHLIQTPSQIAFDTVDDDLVFAAVYGAIADDPTMPLTAPTDLLATAGGDNTIELTWSEVNGATGCTVQRAPDDTFTGPDVETFDTAATHYEDSGLTTGETYFYRVQATGEGDPSEFSAVVSATAAEEPTGNPDELKARIKLNRAVASSDKALLEREAQLADLRQNLARAADCRRVARDHQTEIDQLGVFLAAVDTMSTAERASSKAKMEEARTKNRANRERLIPVGG